MPELPPDQFERLMPLFDEGQPNSTMIYSTLSRYTTGTAYVDDLDRPASALVMMGFQGFSFTHAAVDQQWLNETIATLRPQTGIVLNWPTEFDVRLQPPPDSARVLEGHEFMEYHPQGEIELPAGRTFRMMDEELLERANWRQLMLSAFGSVEKFLANGVGVCVMDGDEICSEAYAAFLGAGKFEIGIVTSEKYRRQNNAYLACKRLVQMMGERGCPPPHWSYFENNVGSDATARKIGFSTLRDYRWFLYPKVE
jgi:hypothetical protein